MYSSLPLPSPLRLSLWAFIHASLPGQCYKKAAHASTLLPAQVGRLSLHATFTNMIFHMQPTDHTTHAWPCSHMEILHTPVQQFSKHIARSSQKNGHLPVSTSKYTCERHVHCIPVITWAHFTIMNVT